MTRWELWIDESGDFASAKDTVCVVGLLRAGQHDDHRVRPLIAQATPGVSWPPHAAWLHPLAMQLAYLQRARVRIPGDQLLELRRRSPRGVALLASYAAEGRVPPKDSYAELQQLDDVIRAHLPGLGAQLTRRRDHMITQLSGVLSALRYDRTSPLECYWVVASEAVGASMATGQRYPHLLRLLLQRARDLLSCLEGPHDVLARVLERNELRHGGLEEVVTQLAPPPQPDAAEVVVRAARARWGPELSPWGVLADFAANQTRQALRAARGKDLESLHNALLARVPVTHARVAGELPSGVACAGPPDAAVEQARRGAEAARTRQMPDLQSVPPWAREQALEWVNEWI